jgi:hypothetical protein
MELSRLPYPLFSPTKWEKEGVVNNVVFPTGHALFGMTFISTMAPLTCMQSLRLALLNYLMN